MASSLRRDPEGARRWQERSRERAREREKERRAKRAAGIPRRSGRRKTPIPKALRVEVMNRTCGVCAVCLDREQLDPTRMSIAALHRLVSQGRLGLVQQLHHILPEQRYRHLALKPWNLLGICEDDHMAHEFAPDYRIPLSAIPAEAFDGADEHGLRWEIEENYADAD